MTENKTICPEDLPDKKMSYINRLPELVKEIVDTCHDERTFAHINTAMIPSRDRIIAILDLLKDIMFPGYFGNQELYGCCMSYHLGEEINHLFGTLSEQITKSIKHNCLRYSKECIDCTNDGYEKTVAFIAKIPEMRMILADDVRASYNGDPAAKSPDEIIFSYPGLYAILVYRIAHELYLLNIPLIPRIMSEYAHSITGIDIHPGATIGSSFCIDHGTGIVIGETTVIGDRVKIYQGVTLGALSIKKDDSKKVSRKRHPTIEDDVILYSNCTILGGKTVIGEKSIVGGNVWLTKSIPSETIVTIDKLDIHKYIRRTKNGADNNINNG